jgi:hypothetical protein
MKKITTFLGILFLVSLIMTGCNELGSPEKKLIGKWNLKSAMGIEVPSGKSYLILNEDKTANEISSIGEFQRTWKINGDELCVKAIEKDGGIESCGYFKIDGNKLTWTVMEMEMIYEK